MRTDVTFLAIERAVAGIDDTAMAGLDVAGFRAAAEAAIGGLSDGAGDGWLGNARAVILGRRAEAADQAVADVMAAAVRTRWPEASVSVGGGAATARRQPMIVSAVAEGVADGE